MMDVGKLDFGIGHNQGPSLAAGSWSGYCWRRARQAAWGNPPIEVIRRRKRRADELGLTYRQYAGILMDRGRLTEALIFDLSEISGRERVSPFDRMAAKLRSLRNCKILAATTETGGDLVTEINARTDGLIADWAPYPAEMRPQHIDRRPEIARPSTEMLLKPILGMLARHMVTPSAAVMIGDGIRAECIDRTAQLARVFPSAVYFR